MSEDRIHIYVASKKFFYGHNIPIKVDVSVNYSEADWDELKEAASRLNLSPKELLKKRFERAVSPYSDISRVESLVDRRRLYSGHSEFWLGFVKYLMYAHVSVLIAGFLLEQFLDTGGKYIVIYYAYIASLLLSFLSWLGFRLSALSETLNAHGQRDAMLHAELFIVRAAEFFMWLSLLTFAGGILTRVYLGIRDTGLVTEILQN